MLAAPAGVEYSISPSFSNSTIGPGFQLLIQSTSSVSTSYSAQKNSYLSSVMAQGCSALIFMVRLDCLFGLFIITCVFYKFLFFSWLDRDGFFQCVAFFLFLCVECSVCHLLFTCSLFFSLAVSFTRVLPLPSFLDPAQFSLQSFLCFLKKRGTDDICKP